MTYILNIETATHICSVALSNNGETIDIEESFEDKTHAELLTVFIEKILERNNLTTKDISAIAVSEGPGSYTGLRIGLSVAKGLCYGLKIPLIFIPTLEAMANGANKSIDDDYMLCPMIDARRMEVYTALYNSKLEKEVEIHAKIIDVESFKEELKNNEIVFFGTGSDKCKESIVNPNATFLDNSFVSAQYMSDLSYNRFMAKKFEDIAYSEPFYLKEFQAIKSTKKFF